ncbi:MAG: dienelactone hydrolase family protein [Novosphingobium sp.]|nr:dienelactone hydrolase family protein [Novosphingobium sp.]
MCDEFTAAADDEVLARKGLTRREFAGWGAASAMAGYAATAVAAQSAGLSEAMVDVTTPDGTCDAFFVHPAEGSHPGVIFWPDAIGLRDAKKLMARRLAGAGYAVLVVNQYYRTSRTPLDLGFGSFRSEEGRAKIMPMMASLTPDAVTRDAAAHVAFLDAQDAVDTSRGIGTQGYCMGGPFTVRTAAAVPGRVRAAASFHGGRLVTDQDDSPHRLLATSQASFLFAVAQDDDAKAPGDKHALRKAAGDAGKLAELEVYAADHSWCVPDAPAYDQGEADRAWLRLLELYSKF